MTQDPNLPIVMGNVTPLKERIKELEEKIKEEYNRGYQKGWNDNQGYRDHFG